MMLPATGSQEPNSDPGGPWALLPFQQDCFCNDDSASLRISAYPCAGGGGGGEVSPKSRLDTEASGGPLTMTGPPPHCPPAHTQEPA